jgi:hypothetical protein
MDEIEKLFDEFQDAGGGLVINVNRKLCCEMEKGREVPEKNYFVSGN